jgi:ferritin
MNQLKINFMGKKLIPEKIEKELNRQMTREAEAAQFYLSFGSWAEAQGYDGIAEFLYHHAAEERNHMMKILVFINQRGGHCKIEPLAAPPADPKTLQELFDRVLDQEISNSAGINKLVDMALAEKEWAAFNFLQWFVKEQIEEETLAMKLVDKMKVIGEDAGNKGGLYEFNQDIRKVHEVKLAQEAREEA